MYDFKIAMINSNFNIKFDIDRFKLNKLLKINKYNSNYDPNIHACVDIKYICEK